MARKVRLDRVGLGWQGTLSTDRWLNLGSSSGSNQARAQAERRRKK